MISFEGLRVGARELAANKLRTALTGLGIVFGVAAVIAMVSIAEGARFEAARQIEALGTNAIRVRAVELPANALSRARQKGVRGLSLADLAVLKDIALVDAVAPLMVLDAPVTRGDRTADARVVGTTPDYRVVTAVSLAAGRFLHVEDVVRRRKVAVLGARAAQDLLPFRDPLGEEIAIGGESFMVVGLLTDGRLASTRENSLVSVDPGRDIYVPAAALELRFPASLDDSELAEIALRVRAGGEIRTAALLVGDTLSRLHAGVADFEVIVPEDLLRRSQQSQRIFNIVMGAIASISLLVGGIGIMNVMLVTVIQRTREIGIRRACGATAADVRDQFLIEALIIATGGGVVGAVLGSALAAIISTYAGWITIVSFKAVIVAFVVAGATGIGFGLFPAIKASRLDPIECLRHE